MIETYTIPDLQEALIQVIKEETGKDLDQLDQYNPKMGIRIHVTIQLNRVRVGTMRLAGSQWDKGGQNDRDHMGAILDELADRTAGDKPKDPVLASLPVNPRIVDLTERLLFGELAQISVFRPR